MISLDNAKADVDEWLKLKLKTGKCSMSLGDELAEGMRQRTIDVHAVYDEISILEGSTLRPRTGTKPPGPLRRQLKGLMHKHYKETGLSSFAHNQLNHWQRPENQARLTEIIEDFIQDGHSGKLTHELVLGAHTGRHATDQMTGEWIIYAAVAGMNYYLTLATHKEPPEAIKERVRRCFIEFPEVAEQLDW